MRLPGVRRRPLAEHVRNGLTESFQKMCIKSEGQYPRTFFHFRD
jgi:hypothetical protein